MTKVRNSRPKALTKEKGSRPCGARPFSNYSLSNLALTSFKTTLRLVDYIDAALTAHDAAIAMTLLERAEGVTYFHVRYLIVAARECAEVAFAPEDAVNSMVDDTGIEPVTPSMSTKCSTAELIIHVPTRFALVPQTNRTRGEPRQFRLL